MKVTDEMLTRFLGWPLPKDFAPDCGVSFDGRKDDDFNKNKTWPTGTNLLNAAQARAMLEYVFHTQPQPLSLEQCKSLLREHLNVEISGDDLLLIRKVEHSHGIF